MTCVLYDGAEVSPLDRLDVDVQIELRIATGTALCTWEAPAAARHVAFASPEGASVVGARVREGSGDWSDLSGLRDGEAWVADLPTVVGALEIEVTWQRVLAAEAGVVELVVPLDDGGADPADPPTTVTFHGDAAATILEASVTGGAVTFEGPALEGSWSGRSSEVGAVTLAWAEIPAPLGVHLLAYRPAVDPFTGEGSPDGYAIVILQPGPVEEGRVDRLFTFVVDTSESMRGDPLDVAVAAGSTWLRELPETDRFDVVTYGSQARAWRATAPFAEPDEVDDAIAWMARQEPMGLSDPAEALSTALSLADDTVQQRTFFGCSGTARGEDGDLPPLAEAPITTPEGRRARLAPYVVLLTDGGASTGETDPTRIAAEVSAANRVGAVLYTVGVGPDADRELLTRLAWENRGEARFAADTAEVAGIVAELAERIANPLLVRPKVAIPTASSLHPAVLPDASAGHELVLAFRFSGEGPVDLDLAAVRGGEDVQMGFPVDLPAEDGRWPGVAVAWARLRVAELDAAWLAGDTSVYDEIRALVEQYGVASAVVTVSGDDDTGAWSDADFRDAAACGCASGPAFAAAGPLLAALLAALSRRRPRSP